jgi:hypothetical protein
VDLGFNPSFCIAEREFGYMLHVWTSVTAMDMVYFFEAPGDGLWLNCILACGANYDFVKRGILE